MTQTDHVTKAVTTYCDSRECPRFLRSGAGESWGAIDRRLLEIGWKTIVKNGTWHHFCPRHAPEYDRGMV